MRGGSVIDRLLQPLLSLHGWPAYTLVGLLVFAEAAVMLGFVFPGETAAILGGVLASKGGVNLDAILAVVVVCAIAGDSVGYAIGDKWGPKLLEFGPLKSARKASLPRSTSSIVAVPWRSSWLDSPPSCAPWSRGWRACPPCTTGPSCGPTPPAGCAGGCSTCCSATSSGRASRRPQASSPMSSSGSSSWRSWCSSCATSARTSGNSKGRHRTRRAGAAGAVRTPVRR